MNCRFALAPMAGYTDFTMRSVCASFGCGFSVTEMVSCRSLIYGAKLPAVTDLLLRGANEKKLAVQLFGFDPSDFREAVLILADLYPDAFDAIEINMGCPALKVTKTGGGSALLSDLPRAAAIIKAAANASVLPIGTKIRTGWDKPDASDELARIAAGEGVSYITVHGRTRAQMFKPPVDYSAIERVKRIFGHTVYGNGDIRGAADALEMFAGTGCDGVMIGRAALHAPWIFAQLAGFAVSKEAKLDAVLTQAREHVKWKGERRAIPELRGKLVHYFADAQNAKRYRFRVQQVQTLIDIEDILREFY
ncbi:MAG: tRNA-dihydrouridine synthase family protein [Oscillospiraceae bacterium]|jgi:nifR3 family TIM-barrel protein|nr:tRNA-dihydrouridine synthase family protein [Oscillospiraceae bacterium]